MQEIAKSGMMGMGSEAGGQALGQIPGILARSLKPETTLAINSLKKHNIPVTAGDYRPGGAAQQIENLLKNSFLGGGVVSKKDILKSEGVDKWRKELIASVGPEFDDVTLGATIKEAAGKRHEDLFGENGLFKRLYEKVDKLYAAKVDVSPVRTWATNEKGIVGRQVAPGTGLATLAGTKEAPSKYLSLLDDLSHFGQKKVVIPASKGKPAKEGWVDVPITYQDVWNAKQNVDSTIRAIGDEALSTRAKGVIKEVHNRLDEAMLTSAAKTDPIAAAKIQKINHAYKQAKVLLEKDPKIAPLRIEGKVNDERVFERFYSKGSITPSDNLYRAIPVQERPRIIGGLRRKTLENFFGGSVTGTPELGVTSLNTRSMMTKYHTYKNELKSWLSEDQMRNLDEFINAAYQSGASGRMINPSSGKLNVAYAQSAAAGGAFVAAMNGNMATVGVGAASIVLPYFIAKGMMNKNISRLIAEGVKLTPGSAEAVKWTPRFLNATRIWMANDMPDDETESEQKKIKVQ
jgi:hypothetical protein